MVNKCSVYKCDAPTPKHGNFADRNNDRIYRQVCGFHYADWKEKNKNAELD